MKRYSIEEIQNQPIAIKVKNREQFEKLRGAFGWANTETPEYYEDLCVSTRGGFDKQDYYKYLEYTIIDFEQINFDDNAVKGKEYLVHVSADSPPGTQIGFKWKRREKETYLQAALKMVEGGVLRTEPELAFYLNSFEHKRLQEYGVVGAWFDPVHAPKFKKGDLVTDDDGKNIHTYEGFVNGRHYAQESVYAMGANVRKATDKEVEKFLSIAGYLPTADLTLGKIKYYKYEVSKQTLEDLKTLVEADVLNVEVKACTGELRRVNAPLLLKLLKMLE